MNSSIIFQAQSTIIVILLYIGVYFRKNKLIHIRLMLTAIIWDILLVLQIQLARGAVQKAVQVNQNHAILNIHVTFAISSVLMYGVMIVLGRALLKGKNVRIWHKRAGILTLTLRTLTYMTSYFVVTGA